MHRSVSRLRAAAVTVLAAATLVAGIPGSAQAAAGDRTVYITFENETESPLLLVHKEINEGAWSTKPPKEIESYDTGEWGSKATRTTGGTEGNVSYESDYGDIEVTWSNPYLADSTFSCDAPEEYDCEVDGGDPQLRHADVSIVLTEIDEEPED